MVVDRHFYFAVARRLYGRRYHILLDLFHTAGNTYRNDKDVGFLMSGSAAQLCLWCWVLNDLTYLLFSGTPMINLITQRQGNFQCPGEMSCTLVRYRSTGQGQHQREPAPV